MVSELNFIEPVEHNGRKGVLLQVDAIKKIEAKFAGMLLVQRISMEKIELRFARQFVK